MFVGICRLELTLMEGDSLKEKRQVVRSIVERLQHRFNISIAETAQHDMLRRAEIGLAAVSNETVYLEKLMGKVVNFVDQDTRVQIINIHKEIF